MSRNEEMVHLYISNEESFYTAVRELVKDDSLTLERATTRALRILPEKHYEARFNRKTVRSYIAQERLAWIAFKAANPTAKD